MDAVSNKQKRNSRWTRNPILHEDGRPLIAQITDRDLEILKLLARYRYLPADDIHAFVGGSLKNVNHRLNLLSRRPNLYINRPHQQRQNAHTNCRPLIYELDERGSRVLRERGLSFLPKSYHRNFAHELMVAQITASFELGTRENAHVRLITWSEIITSPKTPLVTRESPTAASVRVSVSLHGTTKVATDTIDYVATDQLGNTATSTRTVIIDPVDVPSIALSDDATSTATTNGAMSVWYGFARKAAD